MAWPKCLEQKTSFTVLTWKVDTIAISSINARHLLKKCIFKTKILLFLSFLSEMLESSNLVTFNGLANSSSYDAFLLDEERGRLLVGAEDHIFSFDLVNINKDHKQVKLKSNLGKRNKIMVLLLCCLAPTSGVHYSIYFSPTFIPPSVCLSPDTAVHNSITPPGLG